MFGALDRMPKCTNKKKEEREATSLTVQAIMKERIRFGNGYLPVGKDNSKKKMLRIRLKDLVDDPTPRKSATALIERADLQRS
jgi:hypothetical protein